MNFEKKYKVEYNKKSVIVTANNIDQAIDKASYKLAGARRNYIDYLLKRSVSRV